MSFTEEKLLTKGRAGMEVSMAMEGNSGQAAQEIKNYFKIPASDRANRDILAALDDPTFVATIIEMIGNSTFTLPALPALAPEQTILSTYCNGSTLIAVVYNNATGQMTEVDYYDDSNTLNPCSVL